MACASMKVVPLTEPPTERIEVDAQISFVEDDSGELVSLILHQNGANQPAAKIK